MDHNAWDRQIASFEDVADDTEDPLVFIRAPRITRVGEGVEVVATLRGEPITVRSGAIVAMTYHPELTPDRQWHAPLTNALNPAAPAGR